MGRHSAPTRRELRAAAPGAVTPRAGRSPRAHRRIGSTTRRLTAVGIGGAVLGTTVGFVSMGKRIDVIVDGQPTTVTTYATDVEGVLVDAGARPGPDDAVTPSLDSPVTDGSTVSLVRSREVSVVIDGVRTTKNVTAYSTVEAVEQLGLSDHQVVSSRSNRLPPNGAEIELATYDDVTVTVDGGQSVISTAAADVDDALQDAGVTVGEQDTVTPGLSTPVTGGMTIAVTRVAKHSVTETRAVAYQIVEQPDPDEYVGITTVVTPGSAGSETVTVEVSTVDGLETGRTETGSQITTAPVNEVLATGTKQFPAEVNALNWQSLGLCESTNNPKAVNQTNGKYFGEYQFSVETWAGVGGSGNPADAPPEEQLARAKILYMMYGAGQWECGFHLYD